LAARLATDEIRKRLKGEAVRRMLALGAAGLSLSTALVACGGPSGSSGGSKSITYWSMWNKGEPQQQIMQAAIDAFTKDTGIKVNVQFAGRQVAKKLQTANNTTTVPDLVDDTAENLLGEADAGITRGMDDVFATTIPGEGKKISDVIPSSEIGPFKIDKGADTGQYVLVPYTGYATSLWFNDDMMAKIGATPPTTFDELLATCQKAVAAGIACVADDGTIPDYNAYWLAQLISRHLGPDWLRTAAADKTGNAFNDPRFLQAAEDLQKLVQGKGFMLSGYQGSKLPAGQQAWAANKALYLLMGSWAPSDTKSYAAAGFKYDSVNFPSVAGGQMSSDFNAIGFAVTAKAKNPTGAAKFIAYFMNKDWVSQISTKANNLTSRPDIPAPTVLTSVQKQLTTNPASRYLDGTQGTYPDWWSNVLDAADDPLFFGTSTAQEFVSKIQTLTKSYWSSHSG
jgi:raffinose/stachyose/melibiose transport system substrate-binding protein